jgi:LuxR family maltose regulon positive regulatory protein
MRKPRFPKYSSSQNDDVLTCRERDVLNKICDGLTNKRIAQAFGISPETVKSHVKHIFLKLRVSNRAHAVSRSKSVELPNRQKAAVGVRRKEVVRVAPRAQ